MYNWCSSPSSTFFEQFQARRVGSFPASLHRLLTLYNNTHTHTHIYGTYRTHRLISCTCNLLAGCLKTEAQSLPWLPQKYWAEKFLPQKVYLLYFYAESLRSLCPHKHTPLFSTSAESLLKHFKLHSQSFSL